MLSTPTFEIERNQCLLLKAKIVACMTANVKLKIERKGYTPTEIATEFIFRTYDYEEATDKVIDIHSLILKRNDDTVNYKKLQFDASGSSIVDIIF